MSKTAVPYLAAAVRLVDTGDALLAPSITRRLVERFAGGTPRRSAAVDTPALHGDLAPLTPREVEVSRCSGAGCPTPSWRVS